MSGAEPVALVGLFLHTFHADEKIKGQGHVVGRVNNDYFIVEWFEWFTGSPNTLSVHHVSEIGLWTLYDDREHWCRQGSILSERSKGGDPDSHTFRGEELFNRPRKV